jgi:TetR/AcrR family transcriptional repressor of nem operon
MVDIPWESRGEGIALPAGRWLMARYGTDHKQATRRRILEAAGRRLKRDGIDGSGVATLMADAGLTNGAFYAHFDSKEDLVVNTVTHQLREQREAYGARSLEEIVRGYLSVQHRDNTEGGCPSAALLDEIARSSDALKRAYTENQLAIIDDVAARLAPADPRSARVQALGVFALMVGTLQVSRALASKRLADDVLKQGIENALALLGSGGQD